jgi:hypothetical protein
MMEASDAKRDKRFRDRWHEIRARLLAVEKYARRETAQVCATIRIVKGEIAWWTMRSALLAVADLPHHGAPVDWCKVDLLPAARGA